jgi:hypothetical protein
MAWLNLFVVTLYMVCDAAIYEMRNSNAIISGSQNSMLMIGWFDALSSFLWLVIKWSNLVGLIS